MAKSSPKAPAAAPKPKAPRAKPAPAKPAPKKVPSKSDAAYAKKKEQSREYQASLSREGRDIGPLPPVMNPDRRESCRYDFMKFCKTYLPRMFKRPWSKNHFPVCQTMQNATFSGGEFAWCDTRGGGKSTVSDAYGIWVLVYGHSKFHLYIGATKEAAVESFQSVKVEFETNRLLLEDFPEIVYPIWCLEGKANKAKGQILNGEPTGLTWTNDRCILPTIEHHDNTGGMFITVGCDGRLRGRRFKTQEGDIIRPRTVIFDDVQKDKTAGNPANAKRLLTLLKNTVKGMKDRGEKITILVPGTKLNDQCFMTQITDIKENPSYQGRTYKAMYSFPDNMDLWKKYWKLWNDRAHDIRTQNPNADNAWSEGKQAATVFYTKNRKAMDAGCEVAWPEAYEDDELSGIQNLMSIFLADENFFFTEYQNEPRGDLLDGVKLTPEIFYSKVTPYLPKGLIPAWANRLTLGIDVQQNLLYWMVCAWGESYTGHIVEYGTFPEQRQAVFTTYNAPNTLAKKFSGDFEGQLRSGLKALCDQLFYRQWHRADGSMLGIERGLIDANWARTLPVIMAFVADMQRTIPNFSLLPSRGKKASVTTGAFLERNQSKMRTWNEFSYTKKRDPATEACDSVWVNTNFTKSFGLTRLVSLVGDNGSVTIHDGKGDAHALLLDHFTSETYKPVTSDTAKQDIWERLPNRTENHWWDAYCLNIVANSLTGARHDATPAPRRPRKQFTFKDMMPAEGEME